jgi:hypothetical protein
MDMAYKMGEMDQCEMASFFCPFPFGAYFAFSPRFGFFGIFVPF